MRIPEMEESKKKKAYVNVRTQNYLEKDKVEWLTFLFPTKLQYSGWCGTDISLELRVQK